MSFSTQLTWSSGTLTLNPIPLAAAPATSDALVSNRVASAFAAGKDAQLVELAIELLLEDGAGGAAGDYTLTLSVLPDYGLGAGPILLSNTGAVQAWAIAHASGQSERRILRVTVPQGVVQFRIQVSCAGAGQAGSRLTAWLITPGRY